MDGGHEPPGPDDAAPVQERLLAEAESIIDALNRAQGFEFVANKPWLVDRETSPEGTYVEYTYDNRENRTLARFVAKSGSGLGDRTVQRYSRRPVRTTDVH